MSTIIRKPPTLRTWSVYLREGKVYVPTKAKAASGFFVTVEPIDVVDASDMAAVEKAIIRVITAGNPRVPNPSPAELRKPEILSYAKVKSEKEFERGTLFWKIRELGGLYSIIPGIPSPEGGWIDDDLRTEKLPEGILVKDLALRLAHMISKTAQLPVVVAQSKPR